MTAVEWLFKELSPYLKLPDFQDSYFFGAMLDKALAMEDEQTSEAYKDGQTEADLSWIDKESDYQEEKNKQ